ncbi:YlbF family regulator [Bavariicoccus seileri]|uniref:YlbF family regulator n=1 Tax=Bavariicoccus seileri TaxID=549685 RepID=UPI0003B44C28|nr:YlbF family regulator [Bavariicoccus seileri]
MANNIYDTANQLEKDLRDLDAYKSLEQAFTAIQADQDAKALFDKFRNVQVELQTKQMGGQEISEEDIKNAQETAKLAGEHDLIKALMASEQELSVVLEDINRVITKPIQEVYGKGEPTAEEPHHHEG